VRALVSLRKCADYSGVGPALAHCLDAVNAREMFEGKRVFLKINLMKAMSPARAVNTHPEFVRHLIRYVRASGGACMVGDSSGVLGFTTEALRASGIWRVAEEEGAEPVNLDAGEIVPVAVDGKIVKRIYTSRRVLDAEVFVTVPKLKTHSLMLLTGAVKNQIGLVAGGAKCDLHLLAPTPEEMAEAVVDINLAVKPHLAVVDGIIGGEGNGPMSPDAKPCGVILAGTHPAAVDMAAATLMGFDWQKLRLLKNSFEIRKRNFIPFPPSDISLVSNKPEWDGPLGQAGGRFAFKPHFGWVGSIEREPENQAKR